MIPALFSGLALVAAARAELVFALGADEPQPHPVAHAVVATVFIVIALLLAAACARPERRRG